MKCGHCGVEQEEIYYAPSSGFLTHKCEKCGKPNIILTKYELKPVTKKEEDKFYKDNGFV